MDPILRYCSHCKKNKPEHFFWSGPKLLRQCELYRLRKSLKNRNNRTVLGALDPNIQRRQLLLTTALLSLLSIANPLVITIPARNRTPLKVATSLPPAAIAPITVLKPRRRPRKAQFKRPFSIFIDKPS